MKSENLKLVKELENEVIPYYEKAQEYLDANKKNYRGVFYKKGNSRYGITLNGVKNVVGHTAVTCPTKANTLLFATAWAMLAQEVYDLDKEDDKPNYLSWARHYGYLLGSINTPTPSKPNNKIEVKKTSTKNKTSIKNKKPSNTKSNIYSKKDFMKDGAFKDKFNLVKMEVPDGVKCIKANTFYGCKKLKSVILPNSVTSIGYRAFYDCKRLTNIEIPNSVVHIDDDAFLHCEGLTSIEIPDSVTSIGNGAFHGCYGLTSITLGNNVTNIGKHSFFSYSFLDDNSLIEALVIPKSVTSLGEDAFYNCPSGLKSIVVEKGNQYYDSRNDCNAIIETSTNLLLLGCRNTVIPNNVTSIGKNAFYNCSSLTNIKIPDSVTSIGNGAFHNCYGLTSITLGNNITSIGECAFSSCGLTSLKIPDSVTSIGDEAFKCCHGLQEIIIPDKVTSIGDEAFFACSELTSLTLGDNVISIGNDAFAFCKGLTNIKIPDNVTSIGEGAFYHCNGLTSITLGNNVTRIGESAFEYCSKLSSITWKGKTYTDKNKFNKAIKAKAWI
jgi:hypothetical protein